MKKGLSKGLGKGLGALIPDYNEDAALSTSKALDPSSTTEIKVIDIEPNKDQPRKHFDKEQLTVLADSISMHGLIQPIAVKKLANGRYQIIAGERRWRAARLAGRKTVPAMIIDAGGSQVMEMALIENLQRENLNPIEEAVAYKSLMDEFSLTQEQISERVGKSRPAVANTLRLITLPEEIQLMIIKGEISGGHARCLVGIEDKGTQLELAKTIIEHQLSVRQTEQLVKQALAEKLEKKTTVPNKDIYIKDIENRLTKKLGMKVQIAVGAKKSKLEIDYYNNQDLDKLLQILGLNN